MNIRKIALIAGTAGVLFALAVSAQPPGASAGGPPPYDPSKFQKPVWAYAIAVPVPPPATPPPVDPKVYTLPGAAQGFTRAQIRGGADGPADWYPNEHPLMPSIVQKGDPTRRVIACSLCHYPNGKGRAENAAVSGLSTEYFIDTMHDFKSGARKSSEPQKGNAATMAKIAKQMTDEEIKASADYVAAIAWTPWIKVVESPTAPKVQSAAGLYLPLEGAEAGKEPIGQRIVEVPVNSEATDVLRDPHSSFIAYVPPGSIAKGKALVGKYACSACHAADLNGIAFVPAITSRSPSYMARQLNDYRQGARKGKAAQLMGPVTLKMTDDEIIAITAYLASIPAKAKQPG